MNRIELTWSGFKDVISNINLDIKYHDTSSSYYIWADECGITTYYCGIQKNGNDDQTDFEENYKDDANKHTICPSDILDGLANVSLKLRTIYKTNSLSTTDDWQEEELGDIYSDLYIIVTGSKGIIIQLNSSDNDDIPLNEEDDLEIELFSVSKILYKNGEVGKPSTFRYIVLK